MHPHYRGVAFLLTLGSLPIACGKDPDPADTDDTGNGPSPNTSGADTTGPSNSTGPTPTPTTAGPDDTTSTTDAPDITTGPGMTTFLTTNTTTEPTAGSEDTGPPDLPPPENRVCQGYADHLVECYPRYADYANLVGYYCDQYIKYGMRLDGPACVDAIEALFTCFNNLPCAEPNPDDCAAQEAAVAAACPNSVPDEPDTSGTDTFGDSSSGSTG